MTVRSEHLEQKDVVNYFHKTWPKLRVFLWACPSGFVAGGKNKFAIINKMKAEGWKKGVSDLQLALPKGGYNGLFIEMKKANGKESDLKPDQIEFMEAMRLVGYRAEWCAGSNEAINLIDNYMALD